MFREGHAWVYRQYVEDQSLLEDEKAAREAGEGLWGLPEAERTPPWERRAEKRGRVSREAAPSDPGESFTCGTKRYCREMTSGAEARFYLEECGLTRLDGDATRCRVRRSVVSSWSAAAGQWTTVVPYQLRFRYVR
jgi:hypothetical protein